MQTFASTRMDAVQSPVIPIVGEWIRQHPGTISLGQGVVSYGPPPEAIAQISEFLSNPNNHKYQSLQGIAPLRAAIAAKLESENQISLGNTRRVMVTAGSNMGFLNAVLAITHPGDEIILQTPYYFNHEMAAAIAGCHAVCVPTDDNYQLQLDQISAAITDRTRAIVTISPNNPTGAVYPEVDLRDVNRLCRDRGIYHIHDEAYEYFTYNGVQAFSPGAIAESDEHTISLFSLSKAYGFASWRIGYMVIPAALGMAMMKIQDTNVICPAVVSQYAALGALQAGAQYCRDRLGAIAQVRELMLTELGRIPHICAVPQSDGAFYFLLRVQTPQTAMELVERLIRDHGVAALPGNAFGMNNGCYLRIAYAALSFDEAKVGLDRLIQGLKT
jgi:aspartate/methionine/tyrosine aminotransferase